MSKKVLAKGDTNIHRVTGRDEETGFESVQSVLVSFGDSIPADEVASYQLKDIEAGNQPLLELVTDADARKTAKQVEEARKDAEENQRVSMSESAGVPPVPEETPDEPKSKSARTKSDSS